MMSVASSNSKNSPRKVGSRTYYSYSTLYCMNYAPNVLPANEGEEPSSQRERWNNFSRGEHDKQGWIPDLLVTTTSAMKGSAKTCFGDIKTINTYVRNQYLNVNVGGKRRLAVEAKQKWTHDYYVKRMKKLDKDFNGHDEDGGGP